MVIQVIEVFYDMDEFVSAVLAQKESSIIEWPVRVTTERVKRSHSGLVIACKLCAYYPANTLGLMWLLKLEYTAIVNAAGREFKGLLEKACKKLDEKPAVDVFDQANQVLRYFLADYMEKLAEKLQGKVQVKEGRFEI